MRRKAKYKRVTCLKCGKEFNSVVGRLTKKPTYRTCESCRASNSAFRDFGDVPL